MQQGEIIPMIDNFNEKYSNYVQHVTDLHESLNEFNDYDEFVEATPDTKLSTRDFARYKGKHILPEIDFWNILVEQEKIRKNVIKQATRSIQ